MTIVFRASDMCRKLFCAVKVQRKNTYYCSFPEAGNSYKHALVPF